MVVTTPVSQNTVSNIGLRPFYMQALRPVVAIVILLDPQAGHD